MAQKPRFAFSASLRVMDAPELHAEIETVTGLKASHAHVKGEKKTNQSSKWKNNIWIFQSPLDENLELTEHLNWLWKNIKPHATYFKGLLERGTRIDVFCGYRSDCDNAGFAVQPDALEIFTALNVPFEVSCIIA